MFIAKIDHSVFGYFELRITEMPRETFNMIWFTMTNGDMKGFQIDDINSVLIIKIEK